MVNSALNPKSSHSSRSRSPGTEVKPSKRRHSLSSSPTRDKKHRTSKKSKRKKKHSRSNSTSSSSDSDEERERRKRKKAKKKAEKKAKKLLKELKKIQKKKEKLAKSNKSKSDKTDECSNVPLELMDRSRAMVPMTKEEWEKKQSVVRRVYDEETGRHRLIKGDGEVIEEIVSRERHKAINKQATQGDGEFFQSKLPKARR